MSNTPYLPAIEDALYSHAILHLLDVTACIEGIHTWNGPSGRMLGKRVMEYLDECKHGRRMEELTIGELTGIIENTRAEYRTIYHPTDRIIHID